MTYLTRGDRIPALLKRRRSKGTYQLASERSVALIHSADKHP